MPAIRTGRTALHRDMELLTLDDELSLGKRAAPSSPSSSRPTPPTSTKPVKRKKPSNAFILFRSHAIANKMLPETVTHQNDVSRMVAELWRGQDSETRAHFFQMAAEEKLRCMAEEGVEVVERKKKTRASRPTQRKVKEPRAVVQMPTPPPSPHAELHMPVSPAFSTASSSSSDSPDMSSSLCYPISPVDMQLSALTRGSPFELPTYIASPSLAPLEPETDIYIFGADSAFPPLEFEWSATLPSSSLSLKESELTLTADNALDLYFGLPIFEPQSSEALPVGNAFNSFSGSLYDDSQTFPVMDMASSSVSDNGFTDALLGLATWNSSEYSPALDFGFTGGDGALS